MACQAIIIYAFSRSSTSIQSPSATKPRSLGAPTGPSSLAKYDIPWHPMTVPTHSRAGHGPGRFMEDLNGGPTIQMNEVWPFTQRVFPDGLCDISKSPMGRKLQGIKCTTPKKMIGVNAASWIFFLGDVDPKIGETWVYDIIYVMLMGLCWRNMIPANIRWLHIDSKHLDHLNIFKHFWVHEFDTSRWVLTATWISWCRRSHLLPAIFCRGWRQRLQG